MAIPLLTAKIGTFGDSARVRFDIFPANTVLTPTPVVQVNGATVTPSVVDSRGFTLAVAPGQAVSVTAAISIKQEVTLTQV